jgi:YjbE family integral membrane protein
LDFGPIGSISFTWEFVAAFLSIVWIDLILAGDNAVVIALAVKSLPAGQRLKGIIFGAGAAIFLRILLTFFAAQLLQIEMIKLIGGILILWIALKLLIEGAQKDDCHREAKSFWQAIWIIVVADISMSTDNVLAVAAASKGNLFLLIFGLGLSIPLIVFTSNYLSQLMDRYPLVMYIGAAILGRIGGEMIMTDPMMVRVFHPSKILQYSVEVFFVIAVIAVGMLWIRHKKASCSVKGINGT